MKNLYYKFNDAYLGIASLESIQDDTLYFTELPDFVFIGSHCAVYENVKAPFSIPVIRSTALGGAFLFEGGRNLLVSLHTKELTDEQVFIDMVLSAFQKLNINITVQSNDFIYNSKQVGMFAPACKTDYGYYILAQFTFESNFDRIKSLLFFPQTKWVDKPVTNIEDWIYPLSNLGITINAFIESMRTAKLDKSFKKTEGDLMNELKSQYESLTWLEFGEYE